MVTRWNPVDDMLSLRDAMNQLLETSFVRPTTAWFATSERYGFPMNIYERDDTLHVEALLPGVYPGDVQISIDQGTLMIAATREVAQPASEQDGTFTWYLREIGPGRYQRSVTLPFAVDADKAEASFEHGQLRLSLPKAEAARPKRIQIQDQAAEPAQLTRRAS